MSNQTPSVGRVVHYVAYGTPGGEYQPAHRAAIITEVNGFINTEDANMRVGLCVLNPTGMFFNTNVPEDQDTKKPGTWHWPEYVS